MAEVEPGGLARTTIRSTSFRGSRYIDCDFTGAVIRGSEVAGMEIESPWLLEGDHRLLVNGVDVVPLVNAELDRRFPGRGLRAAADPAGLTAAWAALEATWRATLERALAMPPVALDISVDGEWNFTQTLRHLVMATDTWLGRAILGLEHPYHRAGLPNDGDDSAAYDRSDFATDTPPLAEVLAARVDRQAMVRDFIASVTPQELAAPRPNPHAPDYPETVLSCLRTILEEEWEHHRYAVRDLDVIEGRTPSAAAAPGSV